MAAISMLNPKAEVARASQALAVNMAGARGIQVFKSAYIRFDNGPIFCHLRMC